MNAKEPDTEWETFAFTVKRRGEDSYDAICVAFDAPIAGHGKTRDKAVLSLMDKIEKAGWPTKWNGADDELKARRKR